MHLPEIKLVHCSQLHGRQTVCIYAVKINRHVDECMELKVETKASKVWPIENQGHLK